MIEAEMLARSWVALTNVVGRLAPSQRTMEPVTKPVPLTVMAKSGPWAVVEAGLMLLIAGTGEVTLTWTVWLELSDPLNAVRMNKVDLLADTVRPPFLSRPDAFPKSGPEISTF